MKRTTVFILVATIIALVAIGVMGLVNRHLKQKRESQINATSSDAKPVSEVVKLAGDNWAGYSIIRSPEFARFLESDGIGLQYTDDKAAYPERMEKLAAGEYNAIVTTLDAYLSNARKHKYPGVIVFVVDESRGGDGIAALKSIKTVEMLAQPGVKIALTPNSPSDFFLRSVASHFDLAPLKTPGAWRKATDNSPEALRDLKAGTVQAAVLWEPDLTAASLDSRFHVLMNTAKTEGLILDVCVFNRQFVVDRPEVAQGFVRNYFQALRYFQSDKNALVQLVARDARVSAQDASSILKGIEFASLARNLVYWYGVMDQPDLAVEGTPAPLEKEQLLESIRSISDILLEGKLLPEDGLGEPNPRRLLNSSFLETIKQRGLSKTSKVFKDAEVGKAEAVRSIFVYPQLDAPAWDKLKVIGTLKTRPVTFQTGTSILEMEGKESVNQVARDLARYPSYRLLVRGHTAPDGDEEENRRLSEERARTVASYLTLTHEIPASRMKVEGVGGTMPPPRSEGESDRRWKGRAPRVEILLVEDPAIQ